MPHSVLDIPQDLSAPVRLLHLLFRVFLLDIKTQKTGDSIRFWIDEKAVHTTLTDKCLKIRDYLVYRLRKKLEYLTYHMLGFNTARLMRNLLIITCFRNYNTPAVTRHSI